MKRREVRGDGTQLCALQCVGAFTLKKAGEKLTKQPIERAKRVSRIALIATLAGSKAFRKPPTNAEQIEPKTGPTYG
jgi:hypothetical protein